MKPEQVPAPLLLGFFLVALAIAGGIAIAPRRVLNVLFFLAQSAVRQLTSSQLYGLRVLAAFVAVAITILLIKWGVTGVAP